MAKKQPQPKKNYVIAVVSDIHAGCRLSVCSPEVSLDGGSGYTPSKVQQGLYAWWEEYWRWVRKFAGTRPIIIVNVGDSLEGVHHQTISTISNNLADQEEVAYRLLEEPVKMACGRYYHIRGTEAHAGKSGQEEERLAKRLGAVPDDTGAHARYELWLNVDGKVIHFTHHIGTSGSVGASATALQKEAEQFLVDSARWGKAIPDALVRGHRHHCNLVSLPTRQGNVLALSMPSWQLKTTFAFRVSAGRCMTPEVGGAILYSDEDRGSLEVATKLFAVDPPRVELPR